MKYKERIYKIVLYQVSAFHNRRCGGFSDRNSTSRTAGGRIPPKTHAIAKTELLFLLSRPSDYLQMFLQNLKPSTNPRAIGTGYLFCEKSVQYSLRFLLLSEVPRKTEGIASLCAERCSS
ncbi:hypothetical protein AVEN_215471-1 [Araneus ventricosus]|uniref:Uncharacterized protein n=1 Tax=Araneus ventricosus TaxID=182803 RepID=A0A4Y2LD16_ARAVE|nr:hypothetical protein AVEN_215471-1 [Araneus ventricosus]